MVSVTGFSRSNTEEGGAEAAQNGGDSSQQQEAAATNIQRVWRGHHGRDAAKAKAQARRERLERKIAEENRLEAVLLIQTRARIFLARARRRIAADMRHAAVDIQRTWRGHRDRAAAQRRIDQRRQRLHDKIEQANLLEAVITIQTRVRVFLARCRYNILRRARDENKQNVPAVAGGGRGAAPGQRPAPAAPPRSRNDEDAAASNIQRVWRGHEGRQRSAAKRAERDARLRDKIERANLLEAVLVIQTRARIFLARARRRMREELKQHVSPRHRVAQAEDAAVNIQRIWKGHRGRDATLKRMEERRRRLHAKIEQANLLEAVITIQTRVRGFLARCRYNILRRGGNAEQQRQQQKQQRKSGTGGGGGVAAVSARPPNSRAGADGNAAASALRYSLTGRPGSGAKHRQQRDPAASALGAAPSSATLNHPTAVSSSFAASARPMYQVPAVPRSGFFVRSMEEAVVKRNSTSPYRSGDSPTRSGGSRSNGSSPPAGSSAAASPRRGSSEQQQQQQFSPQSPDTAAKVLASPEAIAAFVTKLIARDQQRHRLQQQQRRGSGSADAAVPSSTISKHAALGALIEIFGGDKAPVILSTWENVTPFSECSALTAEQLGLVLMQLRSLRMLSE